MCVDDQAGACVPQTVCGELWRHMLGYRREVGLFGNCCWCHGRSEALLFVGWPLVLVLSGEFGMPVPVVHPLVLLVVVVVAVLLV